MYYLSFSSALQQVLRKLGVQSPVSPLETAPPIVTQRDDNHHGNTNLSNHNNKDSCNIPAVNSVPNGVPPTTSQNPTAGERRRRRSSSSHDVVSMVGELRRTRAQLEELTQELAGAKLDVAEATSAAEQKKMETKQALMREAQAMREVDAARNYIAVLEQKVCESVFFILHLS